MNYEIIALIIGLFLSICLLRMMKAKADFEEDERKVMALVKDYTPETVYHSDRWVPPTKALVKDE